LTRIFELALGLPANYFAAYQDHSLDVLRLNHYAMPIGATRAAVDQMGMGAHTDYGIVTVLWADQVTPGLQILDPGGRWHDVVPVTGGLLVNLGDLLARWTNHRWLSTMHRVLPPIDARGRVTRRRSAAYFHDGNADAVIACLPSCQDADHLPLYEPVTVAEHLAAKLGGSRALKLNPDAKREAARLRVEP
jgi:isopenicillin N synthase-like dioxygenase